MGSLLRQLEFLTIYHSDFCGPNNVKARYDAPIFLLALMIIHVTVMSILYLAFRRYLVDSNPLLRRLKIKENKKIEVLRTQLNVNTYLASSDIM